MNPIFKIMTMLLSDKAKEKILGDFMFKMYKKNKAFQKKVGAIRSKYNLYMNPNNWFNLLKNLGKKGVDNLMNELTKMESETHEQQVFKTDKEAVNKKMNQMNDEWNGKGDWVQLSSSWLRAGKWIIQRSNRLLGTLLIVTKKSSTTYSYPAVPDDVWTLMKEANGSNGGGAGTVFWKYWLRKWLPSVLRNKVYEDIKRSKVTKEDAEELWNDIVTRSGRTFYNKYNDNINKVGPLNKGWYESQGGKGFKTGRRRTYKSLYTATNQKMEYETVTTKWRKYGEFGDKLNNLRKDVRKARRDVIKGRRGVKRVINPISFAKRKGYNKLRKDLGGMNNGE